MSGLALLTQIRANVKTSDLPVVVVTAYPGQFRKNELFAAGCDEFWVKPLDTRTLTEKIAEVVARRKTATPAVG